DDDCTDCSVAASSIVDQLTRAGIPWKAYMEDLPRPCFTGAGADGYAKKHDPFVYYARARPGCGRIVPLSRLARAEVTRTLARFTWITTNLGNVMQHCVSEHRA